MSDYAVYGSNNVTLVFSGGIFAVLLVCVLLAIISLVAMIKVYKKLGLPGWGAIVPIYGQWILLKAVDLPGWLSILPVANGIAIIVANYRLAGKFGKSVGFGLGLVFLAPIFYMILGFGKDKVIDGTEGNVQFDLMTSDPNEGGELNLMAPDPISNIPSEPEEIKGFDLDEKPGLEEQISAEPVKVETIESTPEVLDIPVSDNADNIFGVEEVSSSSVQVNEPSYDDNIFEMPSLKVDAEEEKKPEEIFNSPQFENTISIEKISNPEMPSGEVEMPRVSTDDIAEEIMSSSNSKVCPNCGYANGASMKACVKCGHLLD
ncbi:MAG: DUF5684 domain-containing protein [Bacilli bacterium]